MQYLTNKDIKKILELHSKNYTNRQIEKELNFGHGTVSRHLKANGLHSNWDKREKIDIVDDEHARCTKCKKIYLLSEFFYNRKGQKYEYRFSYCKICRKKQIRLNLNNNIEANLKERYRRLKLRVMFPKRKTKQNINIKFTITFNEFKNQFFKQKGLCFYTKEKLNTNFGEGLSRNSFSIDKIIPELGYIVNNVVFCTQRVNTAKSDFTLDEIKKWMPKWYNKIKKYKKDL